MNSKEFIEVLVNVFPEIKEDVLDEDNEGLITITNRLLKELCTKGN